MVRKNSELPLEELTFVIKFVPGTGIHRRLVKMMRVSEMSASDFIKSLIEEKHHQLVEWEVCNGKR